MMLNTYEIARLCHEVNRAYCKALGDESQPSWDEAPDWQRDSAIAGVEAHMSGQVHDPEGSHNSWLEVKQREGWTYGPVKDPELKQHPCCVPYDQLPAEQKAKDFLFSAIVATVREITDARLGDGLAGDRRL
jgi:hypothetical protein